LALGLLVIGPWPSPAAKKVPALRAGLERKKFFGPLLEVLLKIFQNH
jgi:hypothetical protein